MARQKGFEPPTFRLGGGCSIQLSYRRIEYFSIVPKKRYSVNRIRSPLSIHFLRGYAYTVKSVLEGRLYDARDR